MKSCEKNEKLVLPIGEIVENLKFDSDSSRHIIATRFFDDLKMFWTCGNLVTGDFASKSEKFAKFESPSFFSWLKKIGKNGYFVISKCTNKKKIQINQLDF